MIDLDNPFAAVFSKKSAKAPPVPKATAAPAVGGGDNLVGWLQQAGFKGDALRTAWAIAKRESSGRPEAYNGNAGTGDKSYGLFQINMLGNLGPSRRKSYGLKADEDLLDPATNARVAYAMSKGGKDFGAWGIGPNAYRKMPALDFSGFPGGGAAPAAAALPALQPGKTTSPSRSLSSSFYDDDNPFASVFGAAPVGKNTPDNPFFKVKPPAPGKTKLANVNRVVEGDNIGAQAVRQAATQLGDKYVFGANSVGADPTSFDCSSLVQWSYAQLGIKIPRDTVGQQAALPLKSWKDLQPGDPIYRRSGGHVVIYAGNGKVIAAPHTGTVVQYQSLANFPQDAWEVRAIR